MTETYEQLRDSATGEAGEAWKAADRAESNLRALYRDLRDDPRYTSEHKGATAWERYERDAQKIVRGKARARELLEKQARTAERFSVPFPGEESLTTSDASKLIASQNEGARLVRKIDWLGANAKGPFKPDKVKILKAEYEQGLQTGGVQGAAICRGVLSAASELGVDREAIIDGFRNERPRKNLEDAEYARRLTFTIGGQPPEPPFPKPGRRGRGSDLHTNRAKPLFMSRKTSHEAPAAKKKARR